MVNCNHDLRKVTYDPSFRPIGSSYSMPTQTPVFAKVVWPTKRTVPRLWSPSSVDLTSQRAPIGMSTPVTGAGTVSDGGANRPTLCRCLYASTESGGEQTCMISNVTSWWLVPTCSFRVRVIAQFEFLDLRYVGKLSGERGGGVRIDYLRHRRHQLRRVDHEHDDGSYIQCLQCSQSIKAQLFGVIQKLRGRLALVVLHRNTLILDRDPGDELKFCLCMRREAVRW